DAFMKKAEQLKAFKPGTDQYKKLEEELAKQQSQLKIDASIREREFAERESKIYLASYREVAGVVKAYAERNNISLVLRFNGAPVDQNNPNAVKGELGKMVVYNHKDIDITDHVLLELNKNAPVASQPGGPGGPARPQQPRK